MQFEVFFIIYVVVFIFLLSLTGVLVEKGYFTDDDYEFLMPLAMIWPISLVLVLPAVGLFLLAKFIFNKIIPEKKKKKDAFNHLGKLDEK